ncbi:type IV toxin-antitoxin system AbiEi family antitoxin domain-containing protein [Gordonia malaquae]|uniref:type IV toxin-antitoxin system AbiEi family antitoxin domain-containing protein n=1 Tax=Gordonia malaquae TaxID=410332 RepID=UPI0030C79F42
MYTRAQLLAMGYDDELIRRAVQSGVLVRLRVGWYAARLHDPTIAAAVRDGGVLTCVDALQFHGLWIPPGHPGLHLRRTPHLTGKLPECRPLVGRLRTANEAVDPIPVALNHATRCLDSDEWIAVCDSYRNRTGVGRGDLAADMGVTGSKVIGMLEKTDRRSQSGTESIARVRLRAVGYDVVVQPAVEGVGHTDLRIGKLLLECDSVRHHTSKEDYERDHHRDRRALVDGWIVMRLTYDDILYDWDGVLADIRAITRAGRHRARGVEDRAMVQRSVDLSLLGGTVPSDFDT